MHIKCNSKIIRLIIKFIKPKSPKWSGRVGYTQNPILLLIALGFTPGERLGEGWRRKDVVSRSSVESGGDSPVSPLAPLPVGCGLTTRASSPLPQSAPLVIYPESLCNPQERMSH